MVFAALRRGAPPAPIGTKTSPFNTPEAKAGQQHQGRGQAMYERAHWRAPLSGYLASPLGFWTALSPR
jgi:hypothetical protein